MDAVARPSLADREGGAAASQAPVSALASPSPAFRIILLGGGLAFVLLLLRTAWLDDDAYITFRTVDNIVNGLGPRWNVVNRVQAYTHPLWMLAMTAVAAITREVYFTSLALSIAVSTGALVIAARQATGVPMLLVTLSGLALSKAFVDYSTSGLENPLTHLLLAGFFAAAGAGWTPERHALAASTLTALLMMTRFDLGLLVLPAVLAFAASAGWRRTWRSLVAGQIPLALWELFSLIYYGFPFPNTAYSKLKHGVPPGELAYQGVLYLLDSLANDPVTLTVIAAALVAPFAVRQAAGTSPRGRWSQWAVPCGIVLYLVYIVRVGGDFMSGRFLTGPLLVAVMFLARLGPATVTAPWAAAMVMLWLTGLGAPRPTLASGAGYGADIEPARTIAPTGITDERRYYYQQSGLFTAFRGVPMPNHKWTAMGHDLRARGETFFSTDAAGFIGYAAGPAVHFIDRYGLGDPLLARLPAEVPWRIGHFVRRVPEGYEETVRSGRNVLRDPGVAAYFERLKIITEGPIWSRERLRTIVRMNLGRYERYIADYGLVRVALPEVGESRADGTAWNLEGNVIMTLRGAAIGAPAPLRGGRLELSVSRNDVYDVELMRGGTMVHRDRIAQIMMADSSLAGHTIDVPSGVEFDTIVVRPHGGDARYSLGHLRVVGADGVTPPSR